MTGKRRLFRKNFPPSIFFSKHGSGLLIGSTLPFGFNGPWFKSCQGVVEFSKSFEASEMDIITNKIILAVTLNQL